MTEQARGQPGEETRARKTAAPDGRAIAGSPLLYAKREYLADAEYLSMTTSCQTTTNPNDYGPDD